MRTFLFRLSMIVLVLAVAGCSAPAAPPLLSQPGETEPADVSVPTGEPETPDDMESPQEPTQVEQPQETDQAHDDVSAVAFSNKPRAAVLPAAEADLPDLVTGNSAFALDLYQALRAEPGNLFYSPYSISLALAMTYAGARAETETQMADTLHFSLPQDQLHPAFNALSARLEAEASDEEEQPFRLNIANSIWGQQNYAFHPDFLDTLAENYGAGLRLVDYRSAPELARQQINAWVEDETQDKIKDLIPEGAIDPMTRLVLANAIYFKAAWQVQFNESATQDGQFTLLDGSQVTVPLMHQTESMMYAEGDGWQAVELPYDGGQAAMLVLLPDLEQFEQFEAGLDADALDEILGAMQFQSVTLALPKFKYESTFEVGGVLAGMGMPAAFDPTQADFSGMTAEEDLYIDAILHKAFVDVNEEGTEAAAATAVVVRATSLMTETQEMQIDHPFIYLIRDTETGAVLFVGRVVNPQN